MGLFKLHAPYAPAGDQPQVIQQMLDNFQHQQRYQTLLGVTGSGKTFTLANVISKLNRPVLVLSHNKTLAAQLYSEFKAFFPENAVEYFISYYDYYLPESYIPQTDTYIAKDASINENIEKLRLSATASLVERRDVIVVASVSCLYGLGSPHDYSNLCVHLEVGETFGRNDILRRLVDIQYLRNDLAPEKGEFRVRGDIVDVYEPQRDDFIRISLFGDEIESLERRDIASGRVKTHLESVTLFPCRHFVLPQERIENATTQILKDMKERVTWFEQNNLLVEAQRLYQRVTYDIEMMKEIGYCSGIENYSVYLSQREPGSRPYCLIDFFPSDFLTIIDESHVTLPQLQAMYLADHNRKAVLIDHGFRLPTAQDNRPLKFEEFEKISGDTIYVSATPGKYELERSNQPVELIVRPTGLLDPLIEIRPQEGQVDDVIGEIRKATANGERTIVTTLTKKSSERLADYLAELGIKASYLHSELDALERVRVLNKLRDGNFDCVIGINLLREGIDLPEVALVAILDADKEGFLRSERSMIQTAGRAARNKNGRVILYADSITPNIKKLLDQTKIRRQKQMEYNRIHNITPETIHKGRSLTISEIVSSGASKTKGQTKMPRLAGSMLTNFTDFDPMNISASEQSAIIAELSKEMLEAAKAMEFERAADLRDQILLLQSIKSN